MLHTKKLLPSLTHQLVLVAGAYGSLEMYFFTIVLLLLFYISYFHFHTFYCNPMNKISLLVPNALVLLAAISQGSDNTTAAHQSLSAARTAVHTEKGWVYSLLVSFEVS